MLGAVLFFLKALQRMKGQVVEARCPHRADEKARANARIAEVIGRAIIDLTAHERDAAVVEFSAVDIGRCNALWRGCAEGQLTRILAALAEFRPDLPAELCVLFHKMMSKNPDDRPQTSREIVRELAQNPLFEIANHSYIHPHMTEIPFERFATLHDVVANLDAWLASGALS